MVSHNERLTQALIAALLAPTEEEALAGLRGAQRIIAAGGHTAHDLIATLTATRDHDLLVVLHLAIRDAEARRAEASRLIREYRDRAAFLEGRLRLVKRVVRDIPATSDPMLRAQTDKILAELERDMHRDDDT